MRSVVGISGLQAGEDVKVSNNASLNTLSGRLQLDSSTVVTEGTACPGGAADNGRIARDSNGSLLSCESGVWKKAQADMASGG